MPVYFFNFLFWRIISVISYSLNVCLGSCQKFHTKENQTLFFYESKSQLSKSFMVLWYIRIFCIDLEVHQSSSRSCVVNIMHLCVITFIYLLSWDMLASLLIRNFHNSFAVLASKRLIFIERNSASHFTFVLCVLIEFILSIGIY